MRFITCSLFCLMVTLSFGQSNFTGGNPCTIRIQTESIERNFRSNDVAVRLNRPHSQFEFRIPLESLISFDQSMADLSLLRALIADQTEITIVADLPQDKDAVLDLSLFKGNAYIDLHSIVQIGKYTFVTETRINGMTVSEGHGMVLNFNLCINPSVLQGKLLMEDESVMSIEIFGKAIKIVGL